MNYPIYTESDIHSFYEKYEKNEHTVFTDKFDRFFSYIDHEDINNKFIIFLFFFKNEDFHFVSRFIDQSIFTERFLYELIDDKDINNISDILYNTKNPSMFIHKNNPNKERLDYKSKEIYDDPIKKHKFDIISMLVHKFNNLLFELEKKHHKYCPEKYIFSGNYGLLYLKYLNKFLKIYHPELKNYNKDTKKIDIFLKSCDEDISEKIMNIFSYPIESNNKSANKLNN